MNGNLVVPNTHAATLTFAASRPSWRQKGKSAGQTKSGAGSGTPNWAEHRKKPNWDGPSSRTLGLVLLGLMVPALITAWIWLFPDHESTPFLVISATDYRAPVPPNAFAAEDVVRMRDTFDASYHNIELTEPKQSPNDSASLLEMVKSFLDRVQPGGPNKNVVMIYLSAHGVVNAEGEPCLLLPGHEPLDCDTWLPFHQLLETISEASRLEDCKIVLFLDATRIDDAWRVGLIANTFSIALESLLNETRPPNCFVINATMGLETALAAPEISGTAFGYFVTAGLRGAADEQGNRNSVVTLDELANYLRKQVDSWAFSHRAVHQHPLLISAGVSAGVSTGKKTKQVKLVDVASSAEIPIEAWSPPQPNDDLALWARVEKLEKQQAYAQSPLKWGYLQSLVERYDAELLAGSAYSEQAGETYREIPTLLDEIEDDQKIPYPKPSSLAMRHLLNGPFDAQSMTKTWAAWLEDRAATEAPDDYASAAAFTWQRLVNGNSKLDLDSLEEVLDFCDFAGEPASEEFSEIAMLRLLVAFADWKAPFPINSQILKPLLASRSLSEKIAAPEDPRQHYAIANTLSLLNTNLAAAFDGILSGDEASLKDARDQLVTLLGQGDASFDHIQKQSDLFRRALRSRDRAFASLLHLTQFVARRGKSESFFRTQYSLSDLAENTLELANVLDTMIANSAGNERDFNESKIRNLIQQVDEELDKILSRYKDRVADIPINEQGSSRAIHVETPHLLRCPLEFGRSRQKLRGQWIKQLQQTPDAKNSPTDQANEPLTDKEYLTADKEYLHWLVTSGLTPLEELLDWSRLSGDAALNAAPFSLSEVKPDVSVGELSKNIAQLGGSLRTRLREVPAVCRTLSANSTNVLSMQPAQQARQGFTHADRLSRALAPLTVDLRWFKAGNVPARQLRNLDTQALMMWHGQQFLDDFWGHWKLRSGPYFADAASNLAEQADDLYGTQELRDQIKARRKTLGDWDPLKAEKLSDSGESILRHEIEFRGQSDFRPGRVAVYLTDDNGDLFFTRSPKNTRQRRRSFDTGGGQHDRPMPPQGITHQIPGKRLRDKDRLFANVLFRGHVKKTSFSIGRGVSVPWQKPAPASATVVVRGDAKQVSQLIFIVDCSGSMGKKLESGKRALSNILNILEQQDGKYRVGLVFYGRRASFEKVGKGDGYSAIKPVVLGNEPQNINPSSDVEIVARLRPLNPSHLARIKNELKRARPYGQTPLYLALHTALQKMDSTLAGPRHVIAITDGVDEPYEHRDYPASIKKDAEDVIATNRKVQAQIDVIEFGKQAGGRQDLRNIAANSGGSFHQVASAAELAKKLKDALRLDQYYLKNLADVGQTTPKELHELGSPMRLSASKLPLDFRVLLEQHTAAKASGRLEGGEALRLVYRQSAQNHLGFERYDLGDMREPKNIGGFFVASHVPTGNLRRPVFRVSIQNSDAWGFSPRPEIIWAKVTPKNKKSSGSYYFVDRQFEPGLQAPMLNFLAQDWPGSQFAQIELSFAMKRSATTGKSFPLSTQDAEFFTAYQAALHVKSAGNKIWPLIVTIDEKHDGGAGHFPLHVHLDPQPDQISRTYFESDNRVHHVFRFAVPTKPMMRVLSRQEIESQGVGPIVFENVELPR